MPEGFRKVLKTSERSGAYKKIWNFLLKSFILQAKIRNRLGLALWVNGDLEGAQKQLEAATHLLESIRRETKNSSDYKLSLFELQSSSYQVLQRVLICKLTKSLLPLLLPSLLFPLVTNDCFCSS